MNATFLDRRSSFAITSVAPVTLARCSASRSLGRSSSFPLSTSTNSAICFHWKPPLRKSAIACRCPSSPRPLRPCRAVETRRYPTYFLVFAGLMLHLHWYCVLNYLPKGRQLYKAICLGFQAVHAMTLQHRGESWEAADARRDRLHPWPVRRALCLCTLAGGSLVRDPGRGARW